MIVKVMSVIIALSLVAMAASLGFMAGDRTLPASIKQGPLVLEDTAYPGGQLQVRVQFVQEKRCATHVDRFLYDSKDVRYDLKSIDYQSGASEVGTLQDYTLKIPIPKDAAIGNARYQTASVYKCNMVHYLFPLYGPVRNINFVIRERRPDEPILEDGNT
jgi:hypothetical protein